MEIDNRKELDEKEEKEDISHMCSIYKEVFDCSDRMITCPYCNGSGDCYDSSKTHSRSLEPTFVSCPVCHGQGEVFEDQLENIDCEKSVRELIQQNEDEASLARWEFEQDR